MFQRTALALAFTTLAAGAVLFVPATARAGLDSCGNINVRADARCEVVASGGCTAKCEPVSFQAACAGRLTTQCSGECSATATVDCNASCNTDCTGKCNANPPSFDCKASCTGSCDADCDAQCAGSAQGSSGSGSASGSCKASCSANCSAKCEGQCSATPPSATCEAKCKGSCEGSCQAKASAKCQIDCQAKLTGSCQAELQGGCKAKCTQPEGALFCDGQYVDTGNNLQRCVDALNAVLKVKVSGSASCSGNECNAEGSVSCSAAPESNNASMIPGLLLLGAVGAAVARGRSRKDR